MPIASRCPQCNCPVRVPDTALGRKVRCPACQQAFIAAPDRTREPAAHALQEAFQEVHYPSVPPEAEEESDEEEPQFRRRRGRIADWSKVQIGVSLILASVVVLVVLIPIGALGAFILRMTGTPKVGNEAAEVLGVAILGFVLMGLGALATLLSLGGNVLCLMAPWKNGARVLAIVSLALAVITLMLTAVGFLVPFVGLFGLLAGLAQYFVFLFFLRATARCIRAHELEANVGKLIILTAIMVAGAVVVVGVVLFGILANLARGSVGIFGGLTGCLELVLLLVALIWHLFVLLEARTEIARYIARRAARAAEGPC